MWRDYFNYHKKPDKVEEMYQAFKERMEAEAHGEILEYTPEELADREEIEDNDRNHDQYKKNRYYRKQHATKMGYKFNDYPYDPNRKYK